MKIVIIGSDEVWSIDKIYRKHLEALGHSVILVPAQSIFLAYYRASLFNKVLFRLGVSSIYKKINVKILEVVRQCNPDIVWVFKGMEVLPETLIKISDMGCKLVNYNPDNPFIFTGRGSGNGNVTKSIQLFDLHLTYNLDIKSKLEAVTGKTAQFLPFGYELPAPVFEKASKQDEVVRACFLGNPDAQRAAFIKSLVDRGACIDLYGNGWTKFIVEDKQVRIFPPVYGEEFWMVLRKYRLQLNIMRIHNEDSHNMRSFEVPGVGGILVAPDTTEHRMFFEHGKEAFFYADADDAVKLFDEALRLDKTKADAVREAAVKRSENAGYSYAARAVQVSEWFTELLNRQYA